MRRLLPLLLAAQCAGIAAAASGAVRADAALVAGAAALGVGALGAPRRVRLACALGAAAAAGAFPLAAQLELAAGGRPDTPFEASLEARVVAVTRGPTGSQLALVAAANVAPGEAPVPARLLLWLGPEVRDGPLVEAAAGDRLRLRARVRAPGGVRNPGRGSAERGWARAGFGAVASPVHPSWAERDPPRRSLRAPLARWRRALGDRLASAGPGAGLLRALALGDRSGLAAPDREAFARLGLAHLLSVSGLHLALVAGLAYTAARRLLARAGDLAARRDVRRPALAAAVALAIAYALASGWQVPVRRALAMLLALALAAARARPVARAHPLCGAAVAVLALEPEALFEPGAQLSFAATAGLVLAAGRADAGRPAAWIETAVRTSATAGLVTAPIAAWQLGVAAPAGLAANLIAVPWTGAVLIPAALVGALALAVAPEAEAARAVAGLCERVAAATLAAVRLADGWLPAPAPGRTPAPAALAAALALAAAGLAARGTTVRAAAALFAGLVLAVGPPERVVPAPPRAVFLDVGQGDAALVQGERGALLVDAGRAFAELDRGRDAVVPALGALGVRRVDVFVVTHADVDHRGGAPAVLAAVDVGEVWLPFGAGGHPELEAVRAAER